MFEAWGWIQLSLPNGNVTGVANLAADIPSKRIALLKELVPSARRIALFMHPDEPITALQVQDAEKNSGALGIEPKALRCEQLMICSEAFEKRSYGTLRQ